jgi:hypothetical protein
MFGSLRRDIEAIIDEVIQLSYFMRGAISYEELMFRTPGERQRIGRFIEKRLESESKSMHPVY